MGDFGDAQAGPTRPRSCWAAHEQLSRCTVKALAERAESWLARHLARVPAQVVERVTARRPVVLDGQRLDPRTQHALLLLAAARRPPLDRLPVERARHEYARFPRIFEDRPVTLPRIVDATIPGPAGPLAIRVYD